MNKSSALKKSSSTRRFATGPLGKGKAAKFAKVEGVTTSAKSAMVLKTHADRGLKGDALRSAIAASFVTQKGK